MKYLASLSLLFVVISGPAFAADKPIDYQTLDFSLTLSKLRAGNHDSSGINEYYFQTKLYSLPVLKEEIKKPFADRKKNEADLGKFAEIKIESLKYWIPEKKPVGIQMLVTGDKIRSLIAETMRTNTVPENETSLKVLVEMFEMNKKFGWLGEDTKVGEATFDVIPESLPHAAKLENKTLTITDAQGTLVELNLEFKSLDGKTPKS